MFFFSQSEQNTEVLNVEIFANICHIINTQNFTLGLEIHSLMKRFQTGSSQASRKIFDQYLFFQYLDEN